MHDFFGAFGESSKTQVRRRRAHWSRQRHSRPPLMVLLIWTLRNVMVTGAQYAQTLWRTVVGAADATCTRSTFFEFVVGYCLASKSEVLRSAFAVARASRCMQRGESLTSRLLAQCYLTRSMTT